MNNTIPYESQMRGHHDISVAVAGYVEQFTSELLKKVKKVYKDAPAIEKYAKTKTP